MSTGYPWLLKCNRRKLDDFGLYKRNLRKPDKKLRVAKLERYYVGINAGQE